jgi:alpha-D-ribose 1-methylphosphonate 5-triphosphate synthase subunit PhnG
MKKRTAPDAINPADIILKTSEAVDRKVLQILAGASLSVRREPQTGLVMMTMTDSTGLDFHLGEVLITEAEVELEGKPGYAMVLGDNPEKALARAGVSVLMESADSEFKTEIFRYLQREGKKIQRKESTAKALLASTKVNFEAMTQW